jgi:hypothetical protein
MVFSAADEKAYFWVAWRDNVTERMLGVQREGCIDGCVEGSANGCVEGGMMAESKELKWAKMKVGIVSVAWRVITWASLKVASKDV